MFKHLQSLQWNKLHTEEMSQGKTHLAQDRNIAKEQEKQRSAVPAS